MIDDPAAAERMHVPSRFERLDASVSFHYEPVRYSVDITHVSFRGSSPDLALNSLSGGVAVRNDTLYLNRIAVRTSESSVTVDGAIQNYLSTPVFQLKVASEKLSMPELAAVLPALAGRPLTPAFTLALDGPLSRLKVALYVRSSAGEGWARLVADVDGPQQSVEGDVDVRHLDLAPILADKSQKSDLTVTAQADLHGAALSQFGQLSGSVTFSAPHVAIAGIAADRVNGSAKLARGTMTIDTRAAMYGAGVTAAGQLILPANRQPFGYDLQRPGARPEPAEAAGDAEGAGRADQSERRLPRRRPRRPVGRGAGEPARFDRRGRPHHGAEHRVVLARRRQGRVRGGCEHRQPRPAAHRPRVQGERARRRSLQERPQRPRRREGQRHVGGGD